MKQIMCFLTLTFAFLPAIGFAQKGAEGTYSHVGVAVKVSTLGPGAEVAFPLTSNVNLRGGFNIFSYSRGFDKDGIHYNGDLNFRSVQATVDWFPFHGAFHVSPGLLVYNGNQIKATASVPGAQTFTLNHVTYASDLLDPVRGSGKVDFNKAAPMVLVGWGNLIPRSGRRFSIPFEAGVVFTGAPSAALSLTGTACDPSGLNCRTITSDPTIQSNIQAERSRINSDMSAFKVYPVISIGFAFNF